MKQQCPIVCIGFLILTLVTAACSPEAELETANVQSKPSAPATESPTSVVAATTTVSPPTAVTSETAELSAEQGEVPTGFTEEGAPYQGNPQAAVTLVEYSDFQ